MIEKETVWQSLIEEIMASFKEGQIIPHEYLREKFGIKEPDFSEFDNYQELKAEMDKHTFSYMCMVDELRNTMLTEYKVYLRNVWGEGYRIVPPSEQVRLGFDDFIRQVKKAMRQSSSVMTNVLSVSSEQQVMDNDLRAKHSILKSMFNQSIK